MGAGNIVTDSVQLVIDNVNDKPIKSPKQLTNLKF